MSLPRIFRSIWDQIVAFAYALDAVESYDETADLWARVSKLEQTVASLNSAGGIAQDGNAR